jgi:hypothetical protein
MLRFVLHVIAINIAAVVVAVPDIDNKKPLALLATNAYIVSKAKLIFFPRFFGGAFSN